MLGKDKKDTKSTLLDIPNFPEGKEVNTENILEYLKNLSSNINTAIDLIESVSEDDVNNTNEKICSEIIDEKEETRQVETGYCENTLLISQLDNKVILPYKIKDLEKIYKNKDNDFEDLQQVIDAKYTVPLSYYKNSAISRFREAFKLVREREKGSLKDAIDLGIEIFANYNLHPAVVTACKSINEFDVYLSCLEYNELEDFHFFKVDFKTPPTLTKSKSEFMQRLENTFRKNKDTIES